VDEAHEVPGVTTIPQLSNHAVLDVRPGDQDAATEVEGWLQAYATSRDPQLRQRIILAYLGLAERLASRFRHSRGTSPRGLVQTARAGLIAAVDRYDPDHGRPFLPYAVACVVGELKRYLRDTSWRLQVPRPLKERALRLSRRRSWRHWRPPAAVSRCRWTSPSATTPTVAWATGCRARSQGGARESVGPPGLVAALPELSGR
jgi:hypothetical protein